MMIFDSELKVDCTVVLKIVLHLSCFDMRLECAKGTYEE